MKKLKREDLVKNPRVLCIVTDSKKEVEILKSIETWEELEEELPLYRMGDIVAINTKFCLQYIARDKEYYAAFPVEQLEKYTADSH